MFFDEGTYLHGEIISQLRDNFRFRFFGGLAGQIVDQVFSTLLIQQPEIDTLLSDQFVKGETTSLQFDFVLLCEVIEHLPHPRRAIKNAMKMCNPDGILCVSAPDFEAEGHLRTYSEDTLERLVSRYATVIERKTFERTHPDPTKKITRQHLVLARRKEQ